MFRQIAYKSVYLGLLLSVSSSTVALDDQWYLGIGGGASRLQPDPLQNAIERDEEIGQAATLIFGRDLDNRSSGQFQLYSLGESTFVNGGGAEYLAGNASVLYRFYDSRDARRGDIFGSSIYGMFGLGVIARDSSQELTNNAPVYFGAGAGLETYFTRNLGVRLEAMYHETDVASATVALVTRFGGRKRPPSLVTATSPQGATDPGEAVLTLPVERPQATPLPVPADSPITPPVVPDPRQPQTYPVKPATPPVQAPQSLPLPENTSPLQTTDQTDTFTNEIPDVEIMVDAREQTGTVPVEVISGSRSNDSDADGVDDTRDQCPRSSRGYPVDELGCSPFSSIARLLQFDEFTASLKPSGRSALDSLAELLLQYPQALIELIAHTDNRGSVAAQSNLTRQRLRTLGVYLVGKGISQDRLLLRSFGGQRPAYDNRTPQGQQRNNRIEIFENP